MTEDEVGAWDEVGGAVGLAAVTRFADGPDAAKETGFALIGSAPTGASTTS
jgi:hypothetical protein